MLPTVRPRKALLRCAWPFPLSETEGDAAMGGDIDEPGCVMGLGEPDVAPQHAQGSVLIASPTSAICPWVQFICGAGLPFGAILADAGNSPNSTVFGSQRSTVSPEQNEKQPQTRLCCPAAEEPAS